MTNEQERMLERIAELERRLAHLEGSPKPNSTRGTIVLGTLLAFLLVMAMTAPAWVVAQEEKKQDAQELTCKKLTVVDAAGKPRVVIAFNDKGGTIRLLNNDEKEIAKLDCDATGGTFRIFGNNEKRLLTIGGNKDGCQINACDPDGKIRAYLGVDSVKEGYVSLIGRDDKTVLFAGADNDGGLVRAYGHDGKQRAFFGVGDKKGDGLIMLYGTDGNWRHTICGGNGAYHNFYAKNGKDLVATIGAANDSGEGILRLNTVQGKTTAYLGSNKNGTGGLILLNTPMDSPRVVIGIDANGIGFGEGRDADNVVRRSLK